MAARGPPGGARGPAILDPDTTAFEDGFEDGVSRPDSGPEVNGEADRGEACGRNQLDWACYYNMHMLNTGECFFQGTKLVAEQKIRRVQTISVSYQQAALQAARASTENEALVKK